MPVMDAIGGIPGMVLGIVDGMPGMPGITPGKPGIIPGIGKPPRPGIIKPGRAGQPGAMPIWAIIMACMGSIPPMARGLTPAPKLALAVAAAAVAAVVAAAALSAWPSFSGSFASGAAAAASELRLGSGEVWRSCFGCSSPGRELSKASWSACCCFLSSSGEVSFSSSSLGFSPLSRDAKAPLGAGLASGSSFFSGSKAGKTHTVSLLLRLQ
mmetsp:Transcript_9042/g.20108  ORF Transcript_9042/g.20108 Transcript_9042/m.20108 type:complete len:212 (-) Transcript_9042:224-859(-)